MRAHEATLQQMRQQATLIFDLVLRAVDPEELLFAM